MGTWGFSVTADDTVADIISFVTDELKAGEPIEIATAKAMVEFAELKNDDDEEPLLWLAIAHLQWKYGKVDPQILEHVRHDIASERGLERWRDEPQLFLKRKAALAKFLVKIEASNPKLSKPPKVVIRKAPFAKGDCLAVLLPDGRYTAALVLDENNSNPECGVNLIASLDFLDALPPETDVFKRKEWLRLNHGDWNNRMDINWYLPPRFRQESKRISVVGNIKLGWFIPKGDGSYTGWQSLGNQILLCREHDK
jgi:hypothetical protein